MLSPYSTDPIKRQLLVKSSEKRSIGKSKRLFLKSLKNGQTQSWGPLQCSMKSLWRGHLWNQVTCRRSQSRSRILASSVPLWQSQSKTSNTCKEKSFRQRLPKRWHLHSPNQSKTSTISLIGHSQLVSWSQGKVIRLLVLKELSHFRLLWIDHLSQLRKLQSLFAPTQSKLKLRLCRQLLRTMRLTQNVLQLSTRSLHALKWSMKRSVYHLY